MSNQSMTQDWEKPTDPASLVLEAWSQGVVVGALVMMVLITAANMRKNVLLHKLILIELLIAMPDCFFIFQNPPVYGWYLSTSSMLMITSWNLHNFVAWFKSRPFLSPLAKRIYLWTLILSIPYWVLEIYANYAYFNNVNVKLFLKLRPFEALCRDPWWVFTTVNLFWNIKYRYNFGYLGLIKASPRFSIMMLSMCTSILFITVDVLAVTSVLNMGGLNPFWKLAFIFKCFTDTIILDDFKTVLDKLFERQRNQIAMDSLSESRRSRWTRIVANDEALQALSSTSIPKAIYVGTDIRVTEKSRRTAHSQDSTTEILSESTGRDLRDVV